MEEQQAEGGKADSNLSDDIKCGIQGAPQKGGGGGRETLFG